MIWPFPLFRYKRTDAEISELFRAFARADELQVLEPIHGREQLECRLGRLSFESWHNGFAFGCAGTYSATTGHTGVWKDCMPDRGAVRAIRRAIRLARALRGVPKRSLDDTPIRDIEPRLAIIFSAFAHANDLRVVSETHGEVLLHCELGWLRFWNGNKFSSWAYRGTYRTAEGSDYSWDMKQPTLSAMKAIDVAIQTAIVLRGIGEPARSAPTPSPAPAAPAQPQPPTVTLRQRYAGQALQGILTGTTKADWPMPESTVPACFAWADAMVAEGARRAG